MTLSCRMVKFHSIGDEEIFFQWIYRIHCIEKYEGVGYEIRLFVDEECLRELTGLFYRYDFDLRQLKQFANKQNESWLLDPGAYWHERMIEADLDPGDFTKRPPGPCAEDH